MCWHISLRKISLCAAKPAVEHYRIESHVDLQVIPWNRISYSVISLVLFLLKKIKKPIAYIDVVF